MKPINALITAMLGGLATFAVQTAYFPLEAQAEPFHVPDGPNWRQQVLDRDPGSAQADRVLAHLSSKLELTYDQAQKARTILEQRHQRILALLLTAPPTLTRDQFLVRSRKITAQSHEQLNALLDSEQIMLAQQMRRVHSREG
jgi:hypothetical protein